MFLKRTRKFQKINKLSALIFFKNGLLIKLALAIEYYADHTANTGVFGQVVRTRSANIFLVAGTSGLFSAGVDLYHKTQKESIEGKFNSDRRKSFFQITQKH